MNSKKQPLETKLSSDGRFFERRDTSKEGNFFRDQPGRDDGAFLEKAAIYQYPPGAVPSGADAQVGPQFGTGQGKKKPPPTKTASRSPSDWEDDFDSPLPDGLHRPAREQPEALEAGEERFHASKVDDPVFGAGTGPGPGNSNKMKMSPATSPQMGKSAAPRQYLGTSYGLEKSADAGDWLKARGSEFASSAEEGGRQLASSAGEGLQQITKSPLASLLVAGLGGRALFRAGKRGIGAAARSAGKLRGVPPPPAGLAGRISGAARKATRFLGR